MGIRSAGAFDTGVERNARVFATTDPRSIAVSMWVRPSTFSADGVLFANDSTDGGPSIAMIQRSNGTFNVYSSGAYGTTDSPSLSGLISLDTWNRFGFTWVAASNVLKLFVNGSLVRTTSLAYTAHTGAAGKSIIGHLKGAAGFELTADVAEFAAWQGVIPSDADFQSLWTSAETGLPATAIGSPDVYAPLLGTGSPEADTVGGSTWTHALAASSTIGSSPTHPTITSGGAALKLRSYFTLG